MTRISEKASKMSIDQQQLYQYMSNQDLQLPDDLIPVPEPPQAAEPPREVNDKFDVAFKFAFVGAGQGGSRIAESFYNLGYRKIAAINTAQQDLASIKVENKKCIGDGGAGKDPKVAEKLYSNHADDVMDFLKYAFTDKIDKIFVCVGAGGGSGAGMMKPLVLSSKEIQENAKCRSNKVGLILALPKNSEGKKVCANALQTLETAFELVDSGIVSPLIIIDNEKVAKLFSNLSVSSFWQTANSTLAGNFHLFNLISSKPSSYSSFDKKDYETVLESGSMVFGTSRVQDWKDPISVARSIRENLKNNLICGGFDIKTSNIAAAVALADEEVLKNLPEATLDQGFDQLNRMLGEGSTLHKGIYSSAARVKKNPDGTEQKILELNIFTAVSRLGKPVEKIEELKKLL